MKESQNLETSMWVNRIEARATKDMYRVQTHELSGKTFPSIWHYEYKHVIQ